MKVSGSAFVPASGRAPSAFVPRAGGRGDGERGQHHDPSEPGRCHGLPSLFGVLSRCVRRQPQASGPPALTLIRTAGSVRYARGTSSISTTSTLSRAAPAETARSIASGRRLGDRGLAAPGAEVEDAVDLAAHRGDRRADRVRHVGVVGAEDLAGPRQVLGHQRRAAADRDERHRLARRLHAVDRVGEHRVGAGDRGGEERSVVGEGARVAEREPSAPRRPRR